MRDINDLISAYNRIRSMMQEKKAAFGKKVLQIAGKVFKIGVLKTTNGGRR